MIRADVKREAEDALRFAIRAGGQQILTMVKKVKKEVGEDLEHCGKNKKCRQKFIVRLRRNRHFVGIDVRGNIMQNTCWAFGKIMQSMFWRVSG